MVERKILRIIDANFNRAKEGLRVVEDIFRFTLERDRLRRRTRHMRHALDGTLKNHLLRQAIAERDSRRDQGRQVDRLEMRRQSVPEVLLCNLQRVKESLRVLEEFFKILRPSKVAALKRIRYAVYDLEKEACKTGSALRHSRRGRRPKGKRRPS